MKYQAPFREDLAPVDTVQSNNPTDASYINGDPALDRAGSIPPAAAFEEHQRELVHLIDYSGQDPSHADLEQVRKAIQWMIDQATTQIATIAGGVPVYEGKEDGIHKVRPLVAGTNVTIDVIESSVGSGDYQLRINASPGGGGGGGGSPHENVGDGAQVHKGNDGTNDELRSIVGTGGVAAAQNANDITVSLADIAAWGIYLRNSAAGGAPAATLVTALTNEPTPALLDKLILGKAADGALRSVTVGAVRGTSLGMFAKGRIRIRYDGGTGTWELASTTDVQGGSFSLSGTVTRTLTFTFTTGRANTVYTAELRISGAALVNYVTRANGSASVTLPSPEDYVVNQELDVDLFFFG